MVVFSILGAIGAIGATAAAIGSFVLSVAYQYMQYKKAKKAAAAARDAAAGIEFSVKGESMPMRKYYGYNRAELYPVYWKLSHSYTHAGGLPNQTTSFPGVTEVTPTASIPSVIHSSLNKNNSTGVDNAVTPSVLANCGLPSNGSVKITTQVKNGTGKEAVTRNVTTAYPGLDNPLPGTRVFLNNAQNYFPSRTGTILIERNGMAWSPPSGKPAYTTAAEITAAIQTYWQFALTIEEYKKGRQSWNMKVQHLTPAVLDIDWIHNNGLTSTQGGDRNEFLFVQYVLGIGQVSNIYGLEIDGKSAGLDDYVGHRIHLYNWRGNRAADRMITANCDADRAQALFPQLSYASACFKINRDEPQYGNIPVLEATFRGAPVRTIVENSGNYTLSSEYTFSDNPALILLDYLLDPVAGRGLHLSKIHLKSFYEAMLLCNVVVMPSAQFTSYNAALRNFTAKIDDTITDAVKRFTFNGFIESDRSVRENCQRILESMDDADLIWSEGRYKLVLHYPTSQSEASALSVATFDDNSIIRDTIEIKYPSTDTKLNQASITFANGNKKFASDSKLWPPEGSQPYNTYFEQDNKNPLKTSLSTETIIDPYTALARAEYNVRRSRLETFISFKVDRKGLMLEAGDVITLNSQELNRSYLLKIVELHTEESMVVQITGVEFDYRYLAWNVEDNDPGRNLEIVPAYKQPAYNLAFVPGTTDNSSLLLSAGTLYWLHTPESGQRLYRVYVSGTDNLNEHLIGITDANNISVPLLLSGTHQFTLETYLQGVYIGSTTLLWDFDSSSTLPDYSYDEEWVDTVRPWNTAIVQLYGKSSSLANPPASFSGTMSYDFVEDTLSGGNLNGWDRVPQTVDGPGEYIWMRQARVRSQETSMTIPLSSWSGARLYAGSTPGGVETYAILPETGTELGQVVMKIPEGQLYRWTEEGWSDEIYTDIQDDSITTPKLAANAVTAGKMAVAQLSAIAADLGEITAGSLNINNKFLVDDDGTATIQSAPTGARLVITNERIDVYDAMNTLRVRIGKLD